MQNQQAEGGLSASLRKTSPRQRRRLYELLEEQQEPFLFDHGYSRSSHGTRRKIFCLSGNNAGNNAGRVLQWLSSLKRLKWRRGTDLLRWKIIRKVLHWGPGTRAEGFERLYCSGGLSEGKGEDDREQLSPVSVLEATKEELHQRERLLLDCVEEIMEGRIRYSNRKMEPLIASNHSEPWGEWSHFQTEIGEIAVDVERAIFEEIIREEAVENILSSHYKLERC